MVDIGRVDAMSGNKIIDSETILMKVFGSYYSTYLLDVENDLVTEIKPSDSISEIVGLNVFSWSGEINHVIEAVADPNYHEMLYSFMRLEHIAIAFKESQAPKEFLFKKANGSWRRAFVVPAEMNGSFTRKALLLFNSDFAKDMPNPATTNKMMEDLEKKNYVSQDKTSRILRAVYYDYGSLYEIDVEEDYYYTLYMSPHAKKSPLPEEGKYSEVNLHACEGYIKPEYAAERIRIGNLEYLKNYLRTQHKLEYEFETVVPQDPWKRVSFVALERAADGTPTKIAMAHTAVDELRVAEAQRLREGSAK